MGFTTQPDEAEEYMRRLMAAHHADDTFDDE